MLSLNLSNNGLGELVAPAVLPDGWSKPDPGNPAYRYQHTDGRHQEAPPGGNPEGVIAIANAISNMRAMTSLHVGTNAIPEKQMREIMAIAMRMDSMKILCEVPFKDKSLTELDASGKDLGMEGALVVAEYLDSNGALTSLHVGKNSIPEKEMREIMAIAMHMDSMKILCEVPFKDKSLTELDVSGKNLGTEGLLVVAEYLDGNNALTSLNLSSNNLKAEGATVVVEGIKVANCAIAVVLVCFYAHLTTG
jgi:hypothetical protein